MRSKDPQERRLRAHWGAWAAVAAVAAALLTFLNQLPDFFGRTLPWLTQPITLGSMTFEAWQGLLAICVVVAVGILVVDLVRSRTSRHVSTTPAIERAGPPAAWASGTPSGTDDARRNPEGSPPIGTARVGGSGVGLRGIPLARKALEAFGTRAEAYPAGITVVELLTELRASGVQVAGDGPARTLTSALNDSQPYGIWERRDRGTWVPGSGVSAMETGLSGRRLAEALYDFVSSAYPDGVFHYEEARVRLQATGVDVKGTGAVTRSALDGASDLFEPIPGRNGLWRWQPPGGGGSA